MFSLTTHTPASEFGDSLDPCVCRTELAGAYLYLWKLHLDGRELLLIFDTAGFFSPALACLRILQKVRVIGSCPLDGCLFSAYSSENLPVHPRIGYLHL